MALDVYCQPVFQKGATVPGVAGEIASFTIPLSAQYIIIFFSWLFEKEKYFITALSCISLIVQVNISPHTCSLFSDLSVHDL